MYGKGLNKISGLRSSQSSGRANQLLAKGSPVSKMGRASEVVILEGTQWAEIGKLWAAHSAPTVNVLGRVLC